MRSQPAGPNGREINEARWLEFVREGRGTAALLPRVDDGVSDPYRLAVVLVHTHDRRMIEQRSWILFLPAVTTVIAAIFTVILYRHWQRRPQARYLMWWMIGVGVYGVGTLTEAVTTLFGWSELTFRTWYISGALLGGVLLAQGTVYLLLSKRSADRLTVAVLTYAFVAAVFVVATPIVSAAIEPHRLSGSVMAWQWVRLFSPLLNMYALAFLVGGAAWSAWRYWRRSERPGSRVIGNVLIAVGALLPGVGGSFTRAGMVEVLYVTELVGLLMIWAGYRAMTRVVEPSIHSVQQAAYDE
jgi:MFS family permease